MILFQKNNLKLLTVGDENADSFNDEGDSTFSCSSSSVIHSPCLIELKIGDAESSGEEIVGLTAVSEISDVAHSPDRSLYK